MRITKTVFQIGLGLLGIALLYLGKKTGNNLLTGLGLFCFGPILVITGVDTFIRKQFGFKARMWASGTYETYTGLSVKLWGVYFALLGVIVMTVGAAYGLYPGGPEKLWAGLLGTHLGLGFFLGLIGVMIVSDGLIRILAGTAGHNVTLPANFGNCLARFEGVIVFFFGLALIAFGLIVALAPGILNQLVKIFHL